MELGGASYPPRHRGHDILPTQGVSLCPLLQGRSLVRPKPIFWELQGRYAMRDGPWKLLGREDHPWELYDISRDRCELHDLAAAQPQRVRTMAAAHAAWAQRCGVQSWKQIRPTLVNVPGIG
jgi:arylsulfatase